MKHLLTFLRHDVSATLALTVGSPSFDRRYSALKHLAFMLLFLLGSLNVWGEEVTIYAENFGDNGSSNTAVASATCYSASTIMFTTGHQTSVASNYSSDGKVGKKSVSPSDNSGASGNSAVWYQAGTGTNTKTLFQVSNINIANYSSLALKFNLYRTNGASSSNYVTVTYKIDNGTAQTLTYTAPSSNAKWTWCSGNLTGTGNSLSITFTMHTTGGFTHRIDDIALTGTASSGSKPTDCTAPETALSITSANTATIGTPLTLTSNGGNGGTITWSVEAGTGTASIEGSVLTPLTKGTVTVTATQGENTVGTTKYCGAASTQEITISKAAPTPIVDGMVDQLSISTFGVTSGYTAFTNKSASNSGHSPAVYAGTVARNGTSTKYNIQLNSGQTSSKLREIATSKSGGLARRVYVTWATQSTNTANKKLTVYGSNTAYNGSETASAGTKIGDIVFNTGDAYEYLDIAVDYKYIQIVADGAIYMDQIDVTWVPVPTYAVNLSNTGCTLNVQKGSTPVADNDKFEKGTQLAVSYSASEGYEYASLKVKKTSDMSDVTESVLSGSTLTMPAYDITIEATATKKQYTVTLAATNGKIQVGGVDKTEIVVTHGETAELTAVANDGYAFNGWTSKSANVVLTDAAVNPATITVTGAGTITANFISTTKLNPGFAWSDASAEAVKGQAASLPTLTSNPYSLTPTYVSTNTDVAEINNAGEVTIKAVGSTTIKATYDEDATYADCKATYTLTVKGRVTWHIIKEGTDETSYADYAKDAVPTKPVGVTSCDASISLVGWTTGTYPKSDVAPATLYTEDVPAVTDNADYYAVWGVVEEGGWNEVTTVAGLTAGTYAICSDDYFMKAGIDGGRFQNGTATPSISAGKLSAAPTSDCQWILSINGDGKYLFQNGDNYAGAEGKNSGALLTDATATLAQWEITKPSNVFVVKNIGRAAGTNPDKAYLRNNSTYGWAAYASSTGAAPRFFKYSAGSATGYTTNCVGPVVVTAPEFDVEEGTYQEEQLVLIDNYDGNYTYVYTTDDSEPTLDSNLDPEGTGVVYDNNKGIEIKASCTLKARAYDEDGNHSEVVSAEYVINLPLTTMDAIYEAAEVIGGTAQERVITFNNWVVSGVKDETAYITDGTKGFIIYTASEGYHGLAVNDKISGTVTCQLKLFSQAAEVVGLTKSDITTAGGSVTNDGVVTPVSKSIADLGGINTGAPVIISNVTYNSENQTLVDENDNAIKPYTTLYDYQSTFVNNKIYSVTGIYLQFGNTKELLPRQSEDIVLESKEQPTLKWYVNNTKETEIGATYTINEDAEFAPYFESNSGGAKTYSSTVETVASINPSTGALSIVGVGETVISCAVEADGDYLAGSKSFTLKVRPEGSGDATWVAATWATSESITSNTKFEGNYKTIDIDANVSMTWAKAESSNVPAYNKTDKEARLYNKATLTFNAVNSKQITGIVFHFTSGNEGNLVPSDGSYDNFTWEGFTNSVTFTNNGSAAYIKSIDIEYAQGTTTTLVIEDMIILDNASATDIVFSSNKPDAVVVYSDYDDEVITIAEGKITPVAIGNTSVKASIAAEAPYSSVSITFNVRVKSSSETVETVVILSQFGDKLLAMKHDFTAVEVEKAADGTILDLTCDEEDITWVMTADGASAMFQQPSTNKYLAVGSSNALTLVDEATTWTLHEDGYYYNVSGRTFLYQGDGAKYKNYSTSNAGTSAAGGYSGYATFVAPIFANREELRGGLTEGKWGTYCPDHDVKYPAGASFYTLTYKEVVAGQPYKVFFDEVEPGAALVGGKPYLFIAEGEAIKGIKVGDAAILHNYNGFTGVLSDKILTVTSEESAEYTYYIVYGNEIRLCGAGQFYVPAERAYLDMSRMSSTPVAPAPGRRRISLVNHAAETATGMENVQGDNVQCTKVLIDGQLFILRGEKMYDAKGQLVK